MNESVTRAIALKLVQQERDRQDTLHGNNLIHAPSRYFSIAVLAEEVGEVAEAAQRDNSEDYVTELVQVAAVATAMVQAEIAKNGISRYVEVAS